MRVSTGFSKALESCEIREDRADIGDRKIAFSADSKNDLKRSREGR
jgi:hypothetical protein